MLFYKDSSILQEMVGKGKMVFVKILSIPCVFYVCTVWTVWTW